MAAVAIPTWHHPNHDSFHAPTRPPFQYANPHPHPQPHPQPPIAVTTAQAPSIPIPTPIPARNEKELTRDYLITILNHFSTLVPSHFNDLPIRLVVHGGACMLLHPGLSSLSKEQQQQHHLTHNSPRNAPHNKLLLRRRISTRDVDYVHRSFVEEWRARGVRDAGERIRRCIGITARRFGLGEDWMNSDADVALPMAFDANGKQYDPIYHGAVQPNNVHLHTVFTSTNGMLTLISVPPVWSIALKLVRYTKYDPGDICLLLRNGTNLNNVQWTPQTLESWLHTDAAPMSYELWSEAKRQELKARIQDAIGTVNSWDAETAKGPVIPDSVGGGDDGDGDAAGEEWAHSVGLRLAQDPRWVGGVSSHRSTPALGQDVGIESRWLVQHSQHQQQQQQQQRRHTPSQSQSHSNASHRPSPAPAPAPTPALSHSRSHLHLHTSSWHHPDPRLTSEVRQLDRDIASMLQHSLTVPLGALPSIENGAHQNPNPNLKTATSTTRRSRDKRRAQSRARSRSSKWGAAVMRYFEDEDDGTDEDEDGDGGGGGGGGRDREGERRRWGRDEQQQLQQQHGQPFFPRPSAWLIYAPPPRGGTPQQQLQLQQQQQQRVSSPYHVGMSRPQTLTPYGFTEHRPSSSSMSNTIYPPDHRRSTELGFYDNGAFTEDHHHLHQSSSSTLTPYIPDQRRATPGPDRSSDQQQHVHVHRSATSTPYQHHTQQQYTHQERPTTPFVPPDEYISTTSVVYPDSRSRSRSRSRSSTPYHHMTQRPRSRSRSGSPPHVGPKDRRHRPTPLDLSPIGQLLVF